MATLMLRGLRGLLCCLIPALPTVSAVRSTNQLAEDTRAAFVEGSARGVWEGFCVGFNTQKLSTFFLPRGNGSSVKKDRAVPFAICHSKPQERCGTGGHLEV